jgi:hypothetical protein
MFKHQRRFWALVVHCIPFAIVDSFIACLVEGRQPTATAEEGVQVTRIVAAMHESAQCGQVIFL